MIKPVASIGPIFIGGRVYDCLVIPPDEFSKKIKEWSKELKGLFSTGELLLDHIQDQEPEARAIPKETGIRLANLAGDVYSSFPEHVTLLSRDKDVFFLERCALDMLHLEKSGSGCVYGHLAFLKPRKASVSAIKFSRF